VGVSSSLRRVVIVSVATGLAAFGTAHFAGASSGPAASRAAGPVVRYGVKPIHPRSVHLQASSTLSVGSSDSTGVVSPKPAVYLVFWGAQWSNDPAGAADGLQRMFQGLFGSADTWGTIMNQYCEGVPAGTVTCGSSGIHIQHPSSSPLSGVWFDNSSDAPDNASADDLANEAINAAGHFGNTSQGPNFNAQYVIASPTGTHPDGFNTPNGGFCAYHTSTGSQFGTIAWTNLGYIPDTGNGGCTTLSNPGPLDGYTSTETHEYAEVLTDFFPANGWNGGNGEIGDACIDLDSRLTLSTGTFDVQGLWSNDQNQCTTSESGSTPPPPPPGSNTIVNGGSGKCLDDPGSSTTNGTQLIIWPCHGHANQQWTYNNSQELQVLGKCLDASGEGTSSGTPVIIWTCHGHANQQWVFNDDGTITGVQSGLCLDVTGGSTANLAPIQLSDCDGSSSQQWNRR
jgi:Ricin-type beta-trefoil lectin domain